MKRIDKIRLEKTKFFGIYLLAILVTLPIGHYMVFGAVLVGLPVLYILYAIYRGLYNLVSMSLEELRTPEVEIRGNITILVGWISIGLIFLHPLVGGIFGFVWTAFVMIHFVFTAGNVRYSILTAILFELINIFIVFLMDDIAGMSLGLAAYLFGKAFLFITVIALGFGAANKYADKLAKEKKIIV